jgi:hypothetical protein
MIAWPTSARLQPLFMPMDLINIDDVREPQDWRTSTFGDHHHRSD